MKFDELAPCGIFCGACPAFKKSCNGCASGDTKQKRGSKWKCKLRICCNETQKLDYCIFCNQFPCKPHKKKLIESNIYDPRFTYRHEIASIFPLMKTMSESAYLAMQQERYRCGNCNETVYFYVYKCAKCGAAKEI